MAGLGFGSAALSLDNFGSNGAERNGHVLSSSRISCAGFKPVQLLIKSLNELSAGQRRSVVPFETMTVLHESYGKERRKLLQKRREDNTGEAQRSEGAACGSEVIPASGRKYSSSDELKTTGPVPYAELCFKSKTSTSSIAERRDPERSTVSSFSLGDLRHSSSTGMRIQRLTSEIQRKMCVTVSERDQKIAALMLVKHEEKQERLRLSQQEEQKREEARKQAEMLQEQAERQRRKKLKQRLKCWHKELEARRRRRERQEQNKAGQLAREVLLQEDRWRRLKEEVDAKRREKIEAAQKEAEVRKSYQEQQLRKKEEREEKEREKEIQVAVKKEGRAWRSRVQQEQRERRRLQEENRREQLRHILLKKQVEQRMEEEEAQMRSTLERKFQNFSEKRAHVVEAQMKELQERSVREEEQIQRAQLKAELQSIQHLTHKQILAQLSQRRMENAALHASSLQRSRAQQVRQHNKLRQGRHRRLRDQIQQEEQAAMKARENLVSTKEWRRERLQRQREQIQEEAQRLARASFHMRERVRQQRDTRTFDRMALEAQLAAAINRVKL